MATLWEKRKRQPAGLDEKWQIHSRPAVAVFFWAITPETRKQWYFLSPGFARLLSMFGFFLGVPSAFVPLTRQQIKSCLLSPVFFTNQTTNKLLGFYFLSKNSPLILPPNGTTGAVALGPPEPPRLRPGCSGQPPLRRRRGTGGGTGPGGGRG